MTLEVSTLALLFPAISLLFLSFTNRFLHLSALLLMGGSLACLCYEVWISGGARRILLSAVEQRR